jgi:hypothetical protein
MMGLSTMSERVAYLVFLTVVGLGLAALSVALAVVAFVLIRQQWRARR